MQRVVVCVLLGATAACQTTGDPNDGGLFRWSPQKADDRRADLETDSAVAQNEAISEANRNKVLKVKQAGLSAQARELQAHTDRLLAENQQLDAQLHDMLKRKQLQQSELDRLNEVLKQNERLRQALLVPASGQVEAASEARAEAVNKQNEQMHREIMALLGR
jgi:hypothetical protein